MSGSDTQRGPVPWAVSPFVFRLAKELHCVLLLDPGPISPRHILGLGCLEYTRAAEPAAKLAEKPFSEWLHEHGQKASLG